MINDNKNHTSKSIIQPYIFALKEGKNIKEDLLDYSLMMLQMSKPQIIKAPSVNYLLTELSKRIDKVKQNI